MAKRNILLSHWEFGNCSTWHDSPDASVRTMLHVQVSEEPSWYPPEWPK
jgi:hypothetical protein